MDLENRVQVGRCWRRKQGPDDKVTCKSCSGDCLRLRCPKSRYLCKGLGGIFIIIFIYF
jgi:hypothetical protein